MARFVTNIGNVQFTPEQEKKFSEEVERYMLHIMRFMAINPVPDNLLVSALISIFMTICSNDKQARKPIAEALRRAAYVIEEL